MEITLNIDDESLKEEVRKAVIRRFAPYEIKLQVQEKVDEYIDNFFQQEIKHCSMADLIMEGVVQYIKRYKEEVDNAIKKRVRGGKKDE